MRIIALPLALTLALAACGDSPVELKAKAEAAFADHKFSEAKLLIAEALDSAPGDKALMLLKARTLVALGDGDGAQPILRQLLVETPASPAVIELSAEASLLRNAPDEALSALGTLQSVEAERLRGLAAIRKDEPSAAARHLSAAVALGGNTRTFVDYARLKLIQGDVAAARELAAKARLLQPDSIDSLLLDGQLAVRAGDLGVALNRFERASRFYPDSLAALEGKAATLGDLGRLDEMQAVIDRIAANTKDTSKVGYLKARLAQARKDWTRVRAIAEARKDGLSVRDPLRLLYGESLLRLGQVNQAVAQLGPIVRDQPMNRQAALLLAQAQIDAGNPADAVASLRPLALSPLARREELSLIVKAATKANDPRIGDYRSRLASPPAKALASDLAEGDKAMRIGNWAGAADAYSRILAMTDGSSVLVLNNMAYAQTMLGNFAKADEFARKALKLAPEDASVLDTAGWARFKSGGDPQAAKELLARAAQLAPRNAVIRAHLAEVSRHGS